MTTMHYDAQDLRAIENSGRLDANESVFFARSLEAIRAQTYDVKRVQLNALSLMPVDTSIPEGANTITYRSYDSVGLAKIISNYATDLPKAEVGGKEYTSPIRSIGISYVYSAQEIRSALFSGMPLTAKKAAAASRAHQELINRIAFFGDADHGLPGLLTNANISEVTLLADGTGSSKTWATKTADKIVRDCNAVINKIITQSKGVHRATDLWMPVEQYALIATTQNSVASDTTILSFLQQVHPNVTFRQVVELDGAGSGGTDMIFALENSIENYQLNIPMMMRQYAPQMESLNYEIPCESRCGGVTCEFPLAFAFATGV